MIYLYQRANYLARQDDYIPKKDVYRSGKDDDERRWDDYQGRKVIYHHERATYPAHRDDYMRQTDDPKCRPVSSQPEKSVSRRDADNDPPVACVPRTVTATSKLVGDDVRSLNLMAEENNESRHLDSYKENDAAGTARRRRQEVRRFQLGHRSGVNAARRNNFENPKGISAISPALDDAVGLRWVDGRKGTQPGTG